MIGILKELLRAKRKHFQQICSANGLQLDYDLNKDQTDILYEVFIRRNYADYFPFYQQVTIVDIGAHYGYFSLFAATNTGEQSRIICVEPDRGNYAALQKNMAAHTFAGKVEPLQAAIGGNSGKVNLFKGKAANHSILEDYRLLHEGLDPEEVTLLSLQHIMDQYGMEKIDFLKVDCEGAEYAIFEHTPPAVLEKIDTISMEFHDLKKEKYHVPFLVCKLTEAGFRIVKLAYQPTQRNLNFGNLIATRLFT